MNKLIAFLILTTCFLGTVVSADSQIRMTKGLKDDNVKEITIFGPSTSSHEISNSEAATLSSSARSTTKVKQGVFMLCEGPNPSTSFWVSIASKTVYKLYYNKQCKAYNVLGSIKGGKRYVNHAKVWNGLFTGLDHIYELVFNCNGAGSQVWIEEHLNGRKKVVSSCNNAYEAHAFVYRI